MKFRELEKILKDDGWQYVDTNDSHHHYKHLTKPGEVTLPFHNTDLKAKTANSILKQAGLK